MRETLQRLSEAHVIRQDAVEVTGGEELHPLEPFELVFAQGGLHTGGRIGFRVGLEFAQAPGELGEARRGIEREVGFAGQRGCIDRMEVWLVGIHERREVAQDLPEPIRGDVQRPALGHVDEVVRSLRQLIEHVQRVVFQQLRQDGEQIEAFAVEVEAHRKREPAPRHLVEGAVPIPGLGGVNRVSDVVVDLDRPSLCNELAARLGPEPGPVDIGGAEAWFGKPRAGISRGLVRAAAFQAEEEAVARLGAEVGQSELRELSSGRLFGVQVTLDFDRPIGLGDCRERIAGRIERKFVFSVEGKRACHQPLVTVRGAERLEQKLDRP